MLPTPLLAAALGWAAGMRSMTPPAALAWALAGTVRPRRQPAHALASEAARRALPALAAGELVADKLPAMPARTSPPALAGRVASGALCGAAVAAVRQDDPLPAVVWGALAAGAASFAMQHGRAWAAREWVLPDAAVALAEDAATVALSGLAAASV